MINHLINFLICLAPLFILETWIYHDNSQEKSIACLQTPSHEPISIIGVGDIMLGTNYPNTSYLPKDDGAQLLEDVYAHLQNATITCGNLEGTLLNKGGTVKRCQNPNLCYAFRSPEHYAGYLQQAGFDFLSLANNHSGDFGPSGRTKTKETLDAYGIRYAGLAGTDEISILEKEGIKYGFCGFAPNIGTCDVRNLSRAKEIVRDLSTKADVIIVSFHGGAEGSKHQHVTKQREVYYGENRGNVHAFAHAVIDAGADVVFGHGPHVTRSMEIYNNRFIAYSLGNFCTYGRFNVRGPNGIAPIIKVYIEPDGRFIYGQITPIYQAKTHGPKIDQNQGAIKKLQELTSADFPEGRLSIADDGYIYAQ